MNLKPLQQDIIKARGKKFRIRRILNEIIFKYDPYKPRSIGYLDELISLGNLLSEMNTLGLNYTRKEISVAFNQFYKIEAHGKDKRAYLSFLCPNALKTSKNRIFTTSMVFSKIRDNDISEGFNACDKEKNGEISPNLNMPKGKLNLEVNQ